MGEKLPTMDANDVATAPDLTATDGPRTKEVDVGNNDVEKDITLPTQSHIPTQDIVDWEGEDDPSKPMNW
jgi:hypothetical protein